MKHFYFILSLALFFCQCRDKEKDFATQFSGKPEVPLSIRKEHEDLLSKIHKASLFEDSAGLAARKLNDLMQHHFAEEEDFVLPQLGLLPLLAKGKLPQETKQVIQLSEKLKSNLSHLIAEHQFIKAYMDELKQVTPNERLNDIIELEKELQKHAHTEEEVFFPTAVLIGEYLKLKSI